MVDAAGLGLEAEKKLLDVTGGVIREAPPSAYVSTPHTVARALAVPSYNHLAKLEEFLRDARDG